MSKRDHDNIVAKQYRTVNYQKGWHLRGLSILKKLDLKNFSMLDLGCGNGEFSEIIKGNFNADITCMDYADSHLERVKNLGFKTVKCDFDSSEDIKRFNDTLKNTFDVIVSFEVIEHIFDVDAFLFTIHNLLKNNGILIISTPNIAYSGHKIYSKFRENLPVGEGHHVRFFSPRRLKQTLFLNSFDLLYDRSFGKSRYYLDRAIGEHRISLRSFYINTLFYLSRTFIPESSPSYYSNILFVAKKADVPPFGLSTTVRDAAYAKFSLEEKKRVITRLSQMRGNSFFDEYPGLRKFTDEEASKLSEDM